MESDILLKNYCNVILNSTVMLSEDFDCQRHLYCQEVRGIDQQCYLEAVR